MNATGKKARKRYGNRYAAKRHKSIKGRTRGRKNFGKLPVSTVRGNAEQFTKDHGGEGVSGLEEKSGPADSFGSDRGGDLE